MYPPFEEAFVAVRGPAPAHLDGRRTTRPGRRRASSTAWATRSRATPGTRARCTAAATRSCCVDLRAHGGSEGRDSTLGALERADVRAAARHLRERGLGRAGLVFMGFSLGTAAVMGAAPTSPTRVRSSWRRRSTPRAARSRTTAGCSTASRAGFRWDGWRSPSRAGARASTRTTSTWCARPRGCARRSSRSWTATTRACRRRSCAACTTRTRGRSEIWVAPGVPHVGAILRPDYWERVTGFLDANGL